MDTVQPTDLAEVSSVLDRPLRIESKAYGQSHEIYVLSDKSGARWGLRVAKNDFAAALSKRGTIILKHIKKTQPSLRVPAVIYEAERFALLEYIPGDPLGSWNPLRFCQAERTQLLHNLADVLFDLWTCPNDPQTQELTTTYQDWLTGEVDLAFCRSMEAKGSWGDPLHYLSRRAKVASLVPSSGNATSMIKHGDLNAWNILHHEGQISGIIDWDTARMMPAPTAVQHPLFIADIPGFRNDDVPEDMTFEEDRAILENEIKNLAAKSSLPAAQLIPALLESSFERQFFELSLRNKRINEQYVQRRLVNFAIDSSSLADQLEEFLSGHASMRSHSVMLDIRARLMERDGFLPAN